MTQLSRRWRGPLGAALAAAAFVSCDDPTRPPTVGEIAPRIALIQPDSATRASLVLPLTAVRATSIGPTGRTVDLVQQGSVWRGSLTGLAAGSYEVIIEGIANGQVQFYGRAAAVAVTRGQRAQPSIPFAAAVPTVSNPPLNNTTNFSQRIPYATIAAATGYVVQVSQDNTFASGVIEFAAADTSPLVTVNATGTWHVRSRAVLPQVTPSSIPWSDSRSWVVIPASGGNDAGTATPVAVTPTEPQTIVSRNLTPTKREDWFEIDLRAGDSLFVETFAARLAFASPLNTTLTLFEDDGTTQVAQNLDAPGTTDSRLVYVAAESKAYLLRVGASAGTSGHYELNTEIRRLPAAPTSLSATIVSGSQVALSWNDESDNEASFRVERCVGDACNSFTEIGSAAADAEAFAVDTLTQGLTYRWRVRARNGVGNSAYTTVVETRLVGPTAPSNLVATTAGNTQIGLAWTDASNNETGFEVERCTGAACSNFAPIDTVAADVAVFSDLGVAYNTSYRYRVRALNAVMASAYSAEAAANTVPPATPSALAAAATDSSTIGLSWQDNASDEAGFRIERCSGAACNGFTEIATVGANVTAYSDTSAVYNTLYRYRIRAFHAVVSATYSSIAETDLFPPAAPTMLAGQTTTSSSTVLTWLDNADDETQYVVDRCATAGCTNFTPLATLPIDSDVYNDNSVTVGNTYRYRVRAVGITGSSAPSNIIELNTILPAAPTGLSAQVISADVMRLTWTDASNNESGFVIYRCTGATCTPGTAIDTVAAGIQTVDDSTTVAGVEYGYTVRAVNVSGLSAATNVARANTLPPATPTGFTASAVNGDSVTLAWSSADASITGFRVERCDSPSCSDFVEIAFVPAPSTGYADLTVAPANTYRYRVRAQNAADVSSYTAEQEISLQYAVAPATVTAAVLSATPTLRVTWTASASGGVTGYLVERCVGPGCSDFTSVGVFTAATFEYDDTDVTTNAVYRYRVSAENFVGTGTPSTVAQTNTMLPTTPTGVAAELRTGAVRISWTDNSDNETANVIQRCEGVGCGAFAPVGSPTAADATSFEDATVTLGTTYSYRVIATNLLGESSASSVVTITPVLAAAPSGLNALTASGTQINLSWSDNSLNETGFAVLRCSGAGCVDYAPIDTVAANTTVFSDAGLTQGNDYGYVVTALTGYGSSAASNAVTPNTRLPGAPSGLTATTLSNTSIRLQWTDGSDNEGQFNIRQCAGVGCTPADPAVVGVAAGSTMFDVTGLSPNETYSFDLYAANAVGNSATTNVATATTNLPAVPGPVSAVVQGDGVSIQLQWTLVANATGYSIERCEGAGCTSFAEIVEVPEDGSTFTYIDAGLTGGTTYRYRISAVNPAGNSDFTDVLTTTAGAPLAPTGLVATLRPGLYATLTYTDASDNESGFELERCVGVGCSDFTYYLSVGADTDSTVDVSIPVGNHYRYRLRAYNLVGASAYSNVADLPVFNPDAPTALSATTFSASQIDLTWTDNGPYETGFEIERCQGVGCTNFAVIDTTAADAVLYNDAGLAANQVFRYRVRAVNAVAQSAYTAVAEAATDLPAAPDGLAALALASDEIRLTWNDQSNNENSFLLEYCEGVGCTSFTFLALLAADVEEYIHSGLVSAESYSYRIQAVGSAGSSPFSAVATTDTDSPSVATAVTATTVSGTRIDLSWLDNSSNELGYIVERCSGGGCGGFAPVDTLGANAAAYVDSAVTVDGEYSYRITAYNNVGGVTSVTVSANTLRPAAPTGLTATTVSASQVDLAWTDASTNETGFTIERCAGVGCSDFTELTTVGADVQAYQDVSVAASESYTYRIRATNISGASADAGPATATTLVPAAPASVTATAVSTSQIDVTWTDAADNEQGYRIERCAGASCSNYVEVGTVGADVTTFSSTGLLTSTFYRHRVRAFNAAGTSAYATVATDPTGIFPPTASNTLAALTVSASEVQLTWNDLATNEAGFIIERCTGAGCTSFAAVDTVPPTQPSGASSFLDATAPGYVVLRYRVRAYNGVGIASPTNTAEASTSVPDQPMGFSATAQGQTAAQMSWQDATMAETGYVVQRCLGAACTDFVSIDTLPADTEDYFDIGISGGNVYRYRVFAIGNGRSEYSEIANVSTILPATPTALVATPISNDRVTLEWTDNATDETAYLVYRCSGVGCTPAYYATLGANSTSYEDPSAPIGASVSYEIRALNPAGGSDPSNLVSVETFVPVIPADLAGSIGGATQVDLTWTNNATDELGVIIERCEGVSCSSFVAVDTAAVDATAFSDLTVSAGMVYRYRVRSYNAAGNSGATAAVTLATTVPDAPSGLVRGFAIDATQLQIEWTDEANNEANYLVERCDGTGCATFAPLTTLPAGSTGYIDATTSADTTYRYRVTAVNVIGGSTPAVVEIRTYRPAVATGIIAQTASATQINLTWSVPDSGVSTATFIERCVGIACSDFGHLDGLLNDSTSFTDVGLTPGQTYRYRVQRVNAFGNLGYSAEVESSTDFPIAPASLTATTVAPTQIDLSWTDNSGNETYFIIERCQGIPCFTAYTAIDSVGTDVTTYADASAAFSAEYSYRVRARNGAGASDYTNESGADTFVPDAPGFLSATVTSASSVDLEWPTTTRAQAYVVQRCTLPTCTYVDLDTIAAPTLTYTDLSAQYGDNYLYAVRALNAAGEGGVSGASQAIIAEPTSPGLPTVLAVSPTQAQLEWPDNSLTENLFRIERCEGADCTDFLPIDSVGANVTLFVDATVSTGSKYRYRVSSVNAVGSSGPSVDVLIVMQEPAAPITLTAQTTGPGQITLNWVDNSDNEAQFLLERCAGVGCTDFVQVQALAAGSTGYVDAGLSLNAVYRYQVRAINGVGPSLYSNVDNANTLLPNAATGLTATIVNGQRVDLAWTDNSLNEQGFRVERCGGAGCSNFVEIASLPANANTFVNVGLQYDSSYTYRVKAANISGDAAPTNVASASLSLAAPSGVRATVLSRDSVQLVWNYPATWNSGYQVVRCAGVGCTPTTPIGGLPAGGALSFIDEVPAAGIEYNYSVRAVTVNGGSPSGNSAPARTPIALSNGIAVTGLADNTGGERHFMFTVPAGALGVRFRLDTPGGDADMYVKYGETGRTNVTLNDATNCVPYTGASPELCTFNTPASGDWYVMSQGFNAYTNATLKVSLAERFGFNDPSGGGTGMPPSYLVAQPFTLAQPITGTHLGAWVSTTYDAAYNVVNTPQNVRFGIYSNRTDGSGLPQPNTLLGQFTATFAPGLNEYVVPEMNLPAGSYWIAILAENNMDVTTTGAGATNWRYLYPPTVSYAGGMPASWPIIDNNTGVGVPVMNFFVRGFR